MRRPRPIPRWDEAWDGERAAHEWDERAARLGKRLGIPMPRKGTATMMIRWWADIGMELAMAQPEFKVAKRRGRRPVSDEKDAKRQRRSRARKLVRELEVEIDQ